MMRVKINNCKIHCKIHGMQEMDFKLTDKSGLNATMVCEKCLNNSKEIKEANDIKE